MQFNHGNLAAQPPRPVPSQENHVYDRTFETYIRQNTFSDSPPENASAASVSGIVQSSQAGGNQREHHTALEPIGPHELTWYPQEQGHFPPSGELGESAEQQVPQISDAYPDQQDGYLYDILPQDQGDISLQFAENAGIAMANTNFQNTSSSYKQPFISFRPRNAPAQSRLALGNTNISTPDAYPDNYPHDILSDQGNSFFQFAGSGGVAVENTDFQNVPSLYERPFTSLRPINAPAEVQQPSNDTDIFTPDAYPDEYLHDISSNQGNSSFQFAGSGGIAVENTDFQNVPSLYKQSFTSLMPSTAPAQVQQPSNDTDFFTVEQIQDFYDSLHPQTHGYTGVSNNPDINGMFAHIAQPEGQAVYQSNSWNQTANTPTSMACPENQRQTDCNQWNQTPNIHTQMAYPEIQSQTHWGDNAVHAQAQMPMSFIPNDPLAPPNHQSRQMESKPATVIRIEKLYGITIRPGDYGIFTQGQNPSTNKNKHNMNTGTYGQTPSGGHHSQFLQGSSKNGGAFPQTTSIKRKREGEDEASAFLRRVRRRRTMSSRPVYIRAPQSSSPPPSSPTSPQADDDTSFYDEGDPVETFFIPTKHENKPAFSCRYRFPDRGATCHVIVGGRDRRQRYRHLATHAQYEEDLLAIGDLDVANAVMLSKLKKVVVRCAIRCGWEQEMWRTEHARENHEEECHPDLYARRLQERKDKEAIKLAKSKRRRYLKAAATMLEEVDEDQS